MPETEPKDGSKMAPQDREIAFKTDTIQVKDSESRLAYFNMFTNAITVNYFSDKKHHSKIEKINQYSQSDGLLIHEQKHKDNKFAGLYEYAVSPEQAYKLNMHDEISANMATLVLLRQKYIETGNISVFDNPDKSFDFYKNAIKSGEINPRSNTQQDFDKDMKLIADGTRKMWEKKYKDLYAYQNMLMTSIYCDKDGKYSDFYDENYLRGRKICYTIGGVDFSPYMQQDVEIPQDSKEVLEKYTKSLQQSTVKSSKNEVLNEIDDYVWYFEWKDMDGSRISKEIQKRTLPDMRTAIIKKPNSDKNLSQEQLNKSMQSGHNRVTEMRNKLRQGHTDEANDSTAVSDNTKVEIDKLRFESAIQSRAVSQQPITADYLNKLLKDRQTINR